MYCPSCGNAVAEGLKFCNRCGESLAGGAVERVSASALTGPAWAISVATALVTLGGLSMLFVIGLKLVNRGMDPTPGASIMMLAFLLLIGFVDWLLVRQLSRLVDLHRGEPAPRRRRADATAPQPALEERQMPRLDAMREPPLSVVDQTTRTLEHLPRERDTRPQSG